MTDTRQRKLGSWSFVLVTTVFCIFGWLGRFLPSVFMLLPRKFAQIPVACSFLFFVIFMISIQGVADLVEPYWSILKFHSFCQTVIVGQFLCLWLNLELRKQRSFLITFAVNASILFSMCLTYAIPTGKHL